MDSSNTDHWRRVRQHFDQVLELAPAFRARRVEEIASGDAALADDLRRLLAQLGPEDEVPPTIEGEVIDDLAGVVISDRFRLLHRIGSGGMGDVYLATRTDDLAKQVALKLVRSDLPVPVARARREQQILARLTHPNIAGLIDAGISGNGRPWFAMDHVAGERITDWCDRQRLDLLARARLVASVSRAVQHAHRSLILHRDIKPSNILVDESGEPRLLDFGIAKLLDGTDDQQTQTLALTPAYAAPEQLRGEPATTASDIFQLGLLLFELLAGVPARSARSASIRTDITRTLPRIDQAFDQLVHRDPEQARVVARHRDTSSERLHRALRGDPGRIVAKATAEDPRERYETAQALADDLERWAGGFPVRAHRGSFGYRLTKLVRRHRIAAMIIAVLAVALVMTSIVALRQASAEHAQRLQAEAAGEHADRQRQRAETLLGFMNDVFRQADPQNAGGADLSAEQMLERASSNLVDRADLDPVTRAALMTQVADTFNALFLPERALASAEPAIAALEPVRDQHADEYLRSVVVALDALQMLDRSSEQLALVEQAMPLAEQHIAATPHWRLGLLKYRGAARCSRGEYRSCAEDLRQAVAGLSEDSSASSYATVAALNQLAVLTSDQGNANESARLLRAALDALREVPSALKADISSFNHNLASAEHAQGDFAGSLARLDSIRAEVPALFGADADYIGSIIDRSRARSMAALGRYDQARALIAEVLADLDLARAVEGASRHVMQSHLMAAKIELDLGRNAAAAAHLDQIDRLIASDQSGVDFMRSRRDALRGEVLLQSGDCHAARAVLMPARSRLQELLGDEPSWILGEIEDTLGRCAWLAGDFNQADTLLTAAVGQFAAATGDHSPATERSRAHRAIAMATATPNVGALAGVEAAREALVAALGGENRLAVWQLDRLAEPLAAQAGQTSPHERISRAVAALRDLQGASNTGIPRGISGFN